jgi:hypothetical protein
LAKKFSSLGENFSTGYQGMTQPWRKFFHGLPRPDRPALAKKFPSLGRRFARDDMPWRKVFPALVKGFSTGYQGMTGQPWRKKTPSLGSPYKKKMSALAKVFFYISVCVHPPSMRFYMHGAHGPSTHR